MANAATWTRSRPHLLHCAHVPSLKKVRKLHDVVTEVIAPEFLIHSIRPIHGGYVVIAKDAEGNSCLLYAHDSLDMRLIAFEFIAELFAWRYGYAYYQAYGQNETEQQLCPPDG